MVMAAIVDMAIVEVVIEIANITKYTLIVVLVLNIIILIH